MIGAGPSPVPATLADLVPATREGDAMRLPGRPAITYAALRRAVPELAAGLAGLGVTPGDRVGILSATSPEWVLADLAALHAGATVVPVYHTNSPEECTHVLSHSETRVLIVEDAAQAAKIDRAALPRLEQLVVMKGSVRGALTLDELRTTPTGAPVPVSPDDPATIVYTSGTTGLPKGCVLTHANLLTVLAGATDRLELWDAPPTIFLYLPLAHVLARVTAFAAVATGGTLVFWSGDRDRLMDELAEAAPTHVPTVPRLLEKVHTRVLSSARNVRGAVLRMALAVGTHADRRLRAGTPPHALERLAQRVADRAVLTKVRAVFGPRPPVVLVGAAPIGLEVLEFFSACGLTVLQGYGMTETAAAATLNSRSGQRLGSVGRPLPDTEVAIAEDGEVLMRGPHIFAGYHRDPEATAAALDGGWLHSGDLGHVDEDGFVHITGRKKDLIITSSGKNISPEPIESALRDTRWIAEAVVVGDRRPYLAALVTLDPEERRTLADLPGVPADLESLASDPQVRAAVWQDIEAVNRRFARIEQVKRFAIVPHDFSQASGELTPTLKTKRNIVQTRYGALIAELYQDADQ